MSTPQGTTEVECVGAKPAQLEDLVGAGGHDPVDRAHQSFLGFETLRWTRVPNALVPALDHTEGVEGLDDGQAQGLPAAIDARPDIQKWA